MDEQQHATAKQASAVKVCELRKIFAPSGSNGGGLIVKEKCASNNNNNNNTSNGYYYQQKKPRQQQQHIPLLKSRSSNNCDKDNTNNVPVATRKMVEMANNTSSSKNSSSSQDPEELREVQRTQPRPAQLLLKPQRVAPPPPRPPLPPTHTTKVHISIHKLVPTHHEIVWNKMDVQQNNHNNNSHENNCGGDNVNDALLFLPSQSSNSNNNEHQQQQQQNSLLSTNELLLSLTTPSPSCCSSSSPARTQHADEVENNNTNSGGRGGGGKTVKELAERLRSQFNSRSLLPGQTSALDSAAAAAKRSMRFSQLKKMHEEEEEEQQQPANTCHEEMTAKEVKIDESAEPEQNDGAKKEREEDEQQEADDDSDLDANEYSDMSDATTTTTEVGELMMMGSGRQRRHQSSFGKGSSDTLQGNILNEMRCNGMFQRCGIQSGLPSEVGRLRKIPKKSTRKGCTSEPPIVCMAIQEENNASSLAKFQTEPAEIHEGTTAAASTSSSLLFAHPLNRSHTSNWPPPLQKGQRGGIGGGGTTTTTKTKSASLASNNCSSRGNSTFLDDEDGEEGENGDVEPHGMMETIAQRIPHLYATGDLGEDKRLRELHLIMLELAQMQQSYVVLLQNIAINYPKFIKECEHRMNRRWLVPADAVTPHVIERIASHFRLILGVHEMFLKEFLAKLEKWDSRHPDLAELFKRNGEFLKICSSFLKQKRTLAAGFQQALDENRELAHATRNFEQELGSVMNMRGINIVMQLDAVHQNVVRYRLMMERYRKYLPMDDGHHPEVAVADEALRKLTTVSNTVNEFLADADAIDTLMDLHQKLQGVFDVFKIGRKLLHQGELRRQTRKELQLRYLILFSDRLLICRYNGALGVIGVPADGFDPVKLYKIPIKKVQLEVDDHDDYELEFVVRSAKKSSAFVAKTKLERDQWVRRIREAQLAAKGMSSRKKKLKKLSALYNCTMGGCSPAEDAAAGGDGKPMGGGGGNPLENGQTQEQALSATTNSNKTMPNNKSNGKSGKQQQQIVPLAKYPHQNSNDSCDDEDDDDDSPSPDIEHQNTLFPFIISGVNPQQHTQKQQQQSHNDADEITDSSSAGNHINTNSSNVIMPTTSLASLAPATTPCRPPQHFEAPLWIPDQKATKCMMAGCRTKFTVLRRRHHCRQCGYLICRQCVGYSALWAKGELTRDKVCPQCFYENKRAFEMGTLIPAAAIRSINLCVGTTTTTTMPINSSTNQASSTLASNDAKPTPTNAAGDDKQQLQVDQHSPQLEVVQKPKYSLDDANLRILCANRLFPPSELFIAPANGQLSRIRARELGGGAEQPLAKGKVYLRNQKGASALRWAKLTGDLFLQFYEAEFDEQPSESFFIYGFSVTATETEESGTVIELTHRNQVQTERKEDQIVFHVLNSKSAEKWLDALRDKLTIEKPLEEYDDDDDGDEDAREEEKEKEDIDT